MTVDPKYAALPGIAHDQPDVFETSELPEAEQHLDVAAAGGGDGSITADDTVETLYIGAEEAAAKFKGTRNLDAAAVDFSDRLRGKTGGGGHRHLGYRVDWSGDLELAAAGEEETVEQRYLRLRCEVDELAVQVAEQKEKKESSTANTTGGGDEGSSNVQISDIAGKVKLLQSELDRLGLKEAGAVGDAKKDNSSTAKLLAHLDQLKKTNQKSVEQVNKEEDGTVYELLVPAASGPMAAESADAVQLATLDARLAALERALGADPDTMSSLAVETSHKSLLAAVAHLSARSALLDPQNLDHVEGRLASLQVILFLIGKMII